MSKSAARGNATSADEQASRWVIRHSGQPLDAQAQAEFDAWYQADPRHAAAFDRLARVWRRMGEIDRGKLAARPPRKRRTLLTLAVVTATGMALYSLRDFQPGADYASGTQPLRVALPDGSRAILDAHSAIAVDFGPGKREVRLLSGQALFEASPRGADGPAFTVVTANASATALGTRYTVARDADATRITVYTHQVAVQCLACADAPPRIPQPRQRLAVTPARLAPPPAPPAHPPPSSQRPPASHHTHPPQPAPHTARPTPPPPPPPSSVTP
ncbi:DUF4880 domain-containing protein, partial [Achromobacter ruhlandii]|nr:DUF4880 domain-containing protein [Achromobacter ruhlandii]